jgi:hypothetical protein
VGGNDECWLRLNGLMSFRRMDVWWRLYSDVIRLGLWSGRHLTSKNDQMLHFPSDLPRDVSRHTIKPWIAKMKPMNMEDMIKIKIKIKMKIEIKIKMKIEIKIKNNIEWIISESAALRECFSQQITQCTGLSRLFSRGHPIDRRERQKPKANTRDVGFRTRFSRFHVLHAMLLASFLPLADSSLLFLLRSYR